MLAIDPDLRCPRGISYLQISQAMGTLEPPGIEFHATSISQMLDGKALTRPLSLVMWALAALVVVMAVLTGLLEWGNWRVYVLLVVGDCQVWAPSDSPSWTRPRLSR